MASPGYPFATAKSPSWDHPCKVMGVAPASGLFLTLKCPPFLVISFIILSLHHCQSNPSCSHPHLHPVHPGDLCYFPREIHVSLFGPSLLPSLSGTVDVAWVPFTLQLISTPEWLHTMFVFQGLGYLTQDDFFLLPSNFLMSLFRKTVLTQIIKNW